MGINIGCTRSVLLEIMNSLLVFPTPYESLLLAKWELAKFSQVTKRLRPKEFYQVPNGLLIHEKSAFDRGLYYTTAFLTVAGVVMSLKFFYDSSYPKKA